MRKFYERFFLNEKQGSAFVEAYGSTHEWYVKLGDCDRQITFDFNVYNKAAVAPKRRKLRKLIESLERFETALYERGEEIRKNKDVDDE